MIKILLVSSAPENFLSLENALGSDPKVAVLKAGTAEEALRIAREEKPSLAVVDSVLSGAKPEKLVADFMMVNAMMNTAVVSAMDEEEFHEKTEGLGIMMRLPERPGSGEASKLLETLKGIIG